MEQHQIHQQGRSQQQRQQQTFAENIHDLSFVDIVTGDKVKKIYNWRDRAKKHATATDN